MYVCAQGSRKCEFYRHFSVHTKRMFRNEFDKQLKRLIYKKLYQK